MVGAPTEIGTARARPQKALTAPPDGTTLEDVIGELQSTWGVPQNPQEFRITLKVADEREARSDARTVAEIREEPEDDSRHTDGAARRGLLRRERAPAAPRIGASANGDSGAKRERAGRAGRSRRRRHRGRGGGGSGSAS